MIEGAKTAPGRLAGKTALITGAGAGIGAATARVFASEGAHVMLIDRDAAALEWQLKNLEQTIRVPEKLAAFVADVAVEDHAQASVDNTLRVFGSIDILVNNAAFRNYSAVADASVSEWRGVLDVNLVGVANFCRAALPPLRSSGKGNIVNVSSCYAVTGRKGMAIYDASKAGMLALTRALAHEEALKGVRVNAICPGSTLTDFHLSKAREAGIEAAELLQARRDTSLLGRWASAEEIAWPILWLASEEASYITGTTLMVDGGLHVM